MLQPAAARASWHLTLLARLRCARLAMLAAPPVPHLIAHYVSSLSRLAYLACIGICVAAALLLGLANLSLPPGHCHTDLYLPRRQPPARQRPTLMPTSLPVLFNVPCILLFLPSFLP